MSADDFPAFATETGYRAPQKSLSMNCLDGSKPNEYLKKFPIGLKDEVL